MLKVIAIITGGGLGAGFRHLVFMAVQKFWGGDFPGGTLTANLTGCFLIGLLWSLFEGSRLSNEWRLFIFTGFLGGFTTFSTFARETTQLMKVGEWKTAFIYLAISNVAGILMVFTGYLVTRKFILSA